MEIKVKNIKTQKVHRANWITGQGADKPPAHFSRWDEKTVTKAKLVLVPCTIQDLPVLFRNKAGKYSLGVSEPVSMWNPILISETEKIENEKEPVFCLDEVEHGWNEAYLKNGRGGGTCCACKRILALPEHFSKEQLQMIVEGKLKDGDKMLVECERVKILPGDVEKALGKILYSGASAPLAYQIKSPLSIYPIEEKLYTREEVKEQFKIFSKLFLRYGWNEDTIKWFEQNIK